MANYCFLIRHVLELLRNKDLRTSSKTTLEKFFGIDYDQEIFNDIGIYGHVNEIPSEKPKLREFSLDINSSTEFSSLPTECLARIFENVENVGYPGLFSCLLVCRA